MPFEKIGLSTVSTVLRQFGTPSSKQNYFGHVLKREPTSQLEVVEVQIMLALIRGRQSMYP